MKKDDFVPKQATVLQKNRFCTYLPCWCPCWVVPLVVIRVWRDKTRWFSPHRDCCLFQTKMDDGQEKVTWSNLSGSLLQSSCFSSWISLAFWPFNNPERSHDQSVSCNSRITAANRQKHENPPQPTSRNLFLETRFWQNRIFGGALFNLRPVHSCLSRFCFRFSFQEKQTNKRGQCLN